MGGRRTRATWQRLRAAVSWTPPTSTEIATVAKSALAAGLAWALAGVVTGVDYPVLAPFTALVVVQVSVRASVSTALQRSAAVVLGVVLALAIGDALPLNAFTVAAVVAVSLGVAELLLRLPRAAARQVPISGLIVLSTVASTQGDSGVRRTMDTVVGAAVGVVVSLVLPASRLADARQTLERLADGLGDVTEAMGAGLRHPWSTEQTEEWRRTAHAVRARLVAQATEAIGNGREAARWNFRDRRHIDELGRYEEVLPRLERTAIGVSVISRGLDDHARLGGTTHGEMPAMGAMLIALAGAVRALAHDVLGPPGTDELPAALDEVRAHRSRCVLGATRRARLAMEHDGDPDDELQGEWLGYTAVIVQVGRIIDDLSARPPA